MKVKLVDVRTNLVEDQTFGTCDLCMFTRDQTEHTYVFETDQGKIVEIEGEYWSWGECFEIFIYNFPRFAAWLQEQEFPEDTELGWGWLYAISNKWDDDSEEEDNE